MQTKRLAAAALSFTLLLSACGGDPVPAGGSAQPSSPAQESPSAPPSSGIDTGVNRYRDYVDRYYGFKLKTLYFRMRIQQGWVIILDEAVEMMIVQSFLLTTMMKSWMGTPMTPPNLTLRSMPWRNFTKIR